MKYANYSFHAKGVNNLGDNMQIIAIDEIYRQMGIPSDDIVYIDTNELAIYEGEYVILPVTMPLVDYRPGGISGRFSPYITPVFLGFTMVKDTLSPQEVDYLRGYEPIGCRDERTLNTVRKYNIQAYLNGCITVTLPKRDAFEKVFDKVYIVDAPNELVSYIPEELLAKAEYRTHLHEEHLSDPKELMAQYYKEYKDNASLIITSLLHCSVPCIAAGIPVVLAKTAVSYRFGWLEKLTPIYTPDEYGRINWYPEAVEYDEHKRALLQLAIERLRETYSTYSKLFEISAFYENRSKKNYIVDAGKSLIDFVDENWKDRNAHYKFSIWGLTQIAEYLVAYIRERYPHAILSHVYDSFRTEQFLELTSEPPESIVQHSEEIVFVTTNGAESAARALFLRMNKAQGTYAFMKVII